MKKNLPTIEGNIRDLYDNGPDEYIVVTSDKVALLGQPLPTLIPNKGKLLNHLTAFMFQKIEKLGIPTHFISIDNSTMPKQFQTSAYKNRCMRVKKLDMIHVKFVVRAYLAGNSPAWQSYISTGKICGNSLPAGIEKNKRLKSAIFCPYSVDENGDEKEMTFSELSKLLGSKVAKTIRDYSFKIFTTMSNYAEKHFLIFSDTTFRFGLDTDGNVILAAECLTPDTTRIWDLHEYKVWNADPKSKMPTQYDKEFIIDYLTSSGWTPGETAPELPPNIVERTWYHYIEVYDWLTEKPSSTLV